MPFQLRSILFGFGVALLGCGGGGSESKSTTTETTIPMAPVRFFNAFADRSSVYLAYDGTPLTTADRKTEAGYGEALRYAGSFSGNIQLGAHSAQTGDLIAQTESLTFDLDPPRTLIGLGRGADRKVVAVYDQGETNSSGTAVGVGLIDAIDSPGPHFITIHKNGELLLFINSPTGSAMPRFINLDRGPGTYTAVLHKDDANDSGVGKPVSFTLDTVAPIHLVLYGKPGALRSASLPGYYRNLWPTP